MPTAAEVWKEEGLAEGLMRGRAEGEAKGRAEGKAETLLRQQFPLTANLVEFHGFERGFWSPYS